jgi:hypothetical protein
MPPWAPGFTGPLIKMITREVKILGIRFRPVGEAGSLTAIYAPTVWITWDPHHPITLYIFIGYYGDSFIFLFDKGGRYYVRFEVFTAVTMKKGVFWDVTQCDSFKNRRFGGT